MNLVKTFSIMLLSFNSFAEYQNHSLEDFLVEFHKNPYKVMNQTPYKSQKVKSFSMKDLQKKSLYRKKFLSRYPLYKEEINGLSVLSNLFAGYPNVFINAYELDLRSFNRAEVLKMPWTGYYWSMENGLIGNRYGDYKFNRLSNWKKRLRYIEKHPIDSHLDSEEIERLSPSEKYDLLIGNYKAPITNTMWEEGKKEMATYKEIREWTGLCDGLSMASVNYPWPKNSIKVKSADGKNLIKFYPEDIKALGIYLWSGKNIPLRILGGRCELSSPRTDFNGRIKDPLCQDPNAGAFHLSLINRVGVQKKPLIMDSSTDVEVWNFPIVSYNFTFFNLDTHKKSYHLKDSLINLSDYYDDKFTKYRSKFADFVVGVEAKVEYLTHRKAVQEDRDSESSSSLITVIYRYDLELNSKGDIIGGEWYTNQHPDFLWFTENNADPIAPNDYMIFSDWDPSRETLPNDWIESANSSAKTGQVSSSILKKLFDLSNQGN